jgi:hypothetical protein
MPFRRGSIRHRALTEDTTGNMTLPAPPAEPADQAAASDADTEGDA